MLNKIFNRCFIIACLALFGWACEKLEPGVPDESGSLDGPVDGLSASELRRHLRGDAVFNNQVFTGETGLGPVFVATSCAGCHAGDGKGHPFTALTRFGQADTFGNTYLDRGGPQLQHLAVPGFKAEALPPGCTFSVLVAPAVSGAGFLDAVSDADLLSMADPMDANGDGISGRVNWVGRAEYSPLREGGIEHNGKVIGRFGKKAAVYDLLTQTARAYNQDIGIVSAFEPLDPYTNTLADPEISNEALRDNVFYQRTLKAPPVRNAGHADVIAGRQLFMNIGCETCHRSELRTGRSEVNALAYQTFHPYTDLLLHDMGTALDDHYTEGTAMTAEWRTAPLWGIGLSAKAQGGRYFLLHDGRAHSLQEAIIMHGGEAEKSRERYRALNDNEQRQLILFLENL